MNDLPIRFLSLEYEKIIKEIFVSCGYSAVCSFDNYESTNCIDKGYDIVADGFGNRLAIEVKFSKNINIPRSLLIDASRKIVFMAERDNRIPVIVFVGLVDDKYKAQLDKSIVLLDIRNLLFLIEDNSELKSKLISLLSYSVEDIELVEPDKNLFPPQESSAFIGDSLIKKLINKFNNWVPLDNSSTEYEDLCYDALNAMFYNELTLWDKQKKSNAGLFRFDLICKIKDGANKEFWNMLQTYFSTKYIIFEFKNYKEQISQKEVFTTEKYLYAKGLRNVAVLISANGTDENADKAIRGTLRENGKVIISLSNQDIIKMLRCVMDDTSASDYLGTKLDQLLVDLEK